MSRKCLPTASSLFRFRFALAKNLTAAILALALTCAPGWGQQAARKPAVDFTRLVVLGDSLAAGFQNFSLFDSENKPDTPPGGQRHGFAALIAQQAHADLNLPLVSLPGLPSALMLDSNDNIVRSPGNGLREDPASQTMNLSVPSFTLANAIGYVVDPRNVTDGTSAMALTVLGYPGLLDPSRACGISPLPDGRIALSALTCALQLRPTTLLVDIGNNDALSALTFGTPPVAASAFALNYAAIITSLRLTGATIVAANIPNVTDIPFLTPVPDFIRHCRAVPAGAGPADFVVPNIIDPNAVSLDICTQYAVRSAALIAQTKAAVSAYNSIIAKQAAKLGFPVVDVNGLFARIARNGYNVGGRHLTTEFLGGIFSLDGIHPTNTGYAILANEWIKTMNQKLGTSLAEVPVAQIAQTDPLILSNGTPGLRSAAEQLPFVGNK